MATDFYQLDGMGLPAAPGSAMKSLWLPKAVLDEELEKAAKRQKTQAKLARGRFFADRVANMAQPGAFFSDWNRLTGFNASGGMEKPADEPGFGFLRDSYARSAIDQIIINTRIWQIRQVGKRCLNPQRHAGWTVMHKNHDQPDFVETPQIKAIADQIADVVAHPNPWVHPGGLVDVLSIMVREQLTVDRKSMVISRDRLRRPVARYWHLLDGTTVLPRLQVLYPWIAKHLTNPPPEAGYDEETIQSAIDAAITDVYEASGVDLTDAAYVQEIDSHITAAWLPNQLSIHITQPSVVINKIPFGQGSLLQQSLDLTAGWVNFWQYNQSHFRTNYPEKALILQGEYDPNGLEAYKRKLFGEAGPASWERLLLMVGDEDSKATAVDLGAAPKDLMWDKMADMVIRLKSGVYRMDPSTFGWDSRSSESGIVFNPPNKEFQIAMAEEEGFHGLLQDLSTWFTDTLVKPWHPDYVFLFDGLQRQQERERVELSSQAVEHYLTIDEARAKENLDPLPDGVGKLPMWAAQAKLGAAQQAATAGLPGTGPRDTVPGKDKRLPNDRPGKQASAVPVRKSLTLTLMEED